MEFKNTIVKYVLAVDMLADPFMKNLLPGTFKDLFNKIFSLNKRIPQASPAHPSRGRGGGGGGYSDKKKKKKEEGKKYKCV